jgi:hypothetical protein
MSSLEGGQALSMMQPWKVVQGLPGRAGGLNLPKELGGPHGINGFAVIVGGGGGFPNKLGLIPRLEVNLLNVGHLGWRKSRGSVVVI